MQKTPLACTDEELEALLVQFTTCSYKMDEKLFLCRYYINNSFLLNPIREVTVWEND